MLIEKVKKLNARQRLQYWIEERENIRLKKESGTAQQLWTDDTILQTYRFCNIRRMDDKVSRWLYTNWYYVHFNHHNMLYACALARFFNLPFSLNTITGEVFKGGKPNWVNIKNQMRRLKKEHKVFNGAYMVCGNSKKSPDKIGTVVDEFVRPLENITVRTDSMEDTYNELKKSHGIASFMAGQITADLRWAMKGKWSDRYEWAPVGPGSARGLARLLYCDEWPSVATRYRSHQDEWLSDFKEYVLSASFKSKLPGPIRIRLEAHDYQNCLCEFDKYERALWGEGKPKQLYRSDR